MEVSHVFMIFRFENDPLKYVCTPHISFFKTVEVRARTSSTLCKYYFNSTSDIKLHASLFHSLLSAKAQMRGNIQSYYTNDTQRKRDSLS